MPSVVHLVLEGVDAAGPAPRRPRAHNNVYITLIICHYVTGWACYHITRAETEAMIKDQPDLGRGDRGWATTELHLNMTTAKSRRTAHEIAAGSVATAWARARQTARQLSRWFQVNIRDDRDVAAIKLGPGKLLWCSPSGKCRTKENFQSYNRACHHFGIADNRSKQTSARIDYKLVIYESLCMVRAPASQPHIYLDPPFGFSGSAPEQHSAS